MIKLFNARRIVTVLDMNTSAKRYLRHLEIHRPIRRAIRVYSQRERQRGERERLTYARCAPKLYRCTVVRSLSRENVTTDSWNSFEKTVRFNGIDPERSKPPAADQLDGAGRSIRSERDAHRACTRTGLRDEN